MSESVHLLSATMPMPVMPAVVFEPFEPAVPEPARNPVPTLDQIRTIERAMMELPQAECRSVNHFAPHVCVREGFIPAGTLVTGRMLRHEHLSILAQGELKVTTDEGVVLLKAPAVIHAKAATKRIALTITDVVWYAIHVTDETDEQRLIDELTYPEPVAFDAFALGSHDGCSP